MTDERYEYPESRGDEQWVECIILIPRRNIGTLTQTIYNSPHLSGLDVMVQVLPPKKSREVVACLREEAVSKKIAELCRLRFQYEQKLYCVEEQVAQFGAATLTQTYLMHQVEWSCLVKLRQILATRFDEHELRTPCFDLAVDYDDLPGQGRASKARELVSHFQHHDRIPELVEVGKQQRPDISWGNVQEAARGAQLLRKKKQLEIDVQEIDREISEKAGPPERVCREYVNVPNS
jgi:hypothetical protein